MAFSTPVRLLILIAIVLVAYCFWPRTPSLTTFDPKKMAAHYEAIWRDASKKSFNSVYWQQYFHHEGDYHIPPVESLNMAGNVTRALSLLQSPASADREQATTILREYFIRLRDVTKSNFEPAEIAVQDTIWQSEPAADESRTTDPVDALTTVLAIMYNGDHAQFADAAQAIVDARKQVIEATDADSKKKASEATLAGFQLLQVAIMNKGATASGESTETTAQ